MNPLDKIPESKRKQIEKLLFFAGHDGTEFEGEKAAAQKLAESLCAKYGCTVSDFGSQRFKQFVRQTNEFKKSADYTTNIRTVTKTGWFVSVSEIAETYGFTFEYFNDGSFVFKNPGDTSYIEIQFNGHWIVYNQFGQKVSEESYPGDLLWFLKTRPDRTLAAGIQRELAAVD